MPVRLLSFTLTILVVAATLTLVVIGEDLLIPLAIAVMVWYLLNAFSRMYGRISLAGKTLPGWACFSLSLLTFLTGFVLVGNMITNNVAEVTLAAPGYQENLDRIVQEVAQLLGLEQVPTLPDLVAHIDIGSAITGVAGSLAALIGNLGIVLVYVLFLLIEQQHFDSKLQALFPNRGRQEEVRRLLSRMQADIQTYVWIKTVMSMLTGGVSYVILLIVGVDYAEFWGFIIFMLNYIPTVGSLLGIVFPALLTIVQFGTLGPFLVVISTLSGAQFLIGNILETRLMGGRLNISPLVVILSLSVWGTLWGIAGMFLCMPITVILMIICSHFERTRPIAVVLSGTGQVTPAGESAASDALGWSADDTRPPDDRSGG